MTQPSGSTDSYVLGTAATERERLARQHATWRADTFTGWDQAGFRAGQRLLDLGCGPGFAALDLAERVGPAGTVLALDNAAPYLEHLQREAQARGLEQLRTLRFDLGTSSSSGQVEAAIGSGNWDGAWCRWLAMFLPDPAALIAVVAQALRPGGRLVLHEYVHWDTFALHPSGEAVETFVRRCISHWQANGGDPHVARRLPGLLEAAGLRLVEARSLMACEPGDGPKALWLQDFLRCYTPQLAAAGLWSAAEQQALDTEILRARQHPSLWVTPALVEQIWEQPGSS
jgi:SAM-dependent methyltransferase